MKRITWLLLAILIIAGSAQLSAFQEPFEDDNAAVRYLMAMGYMPELSWDEESALRDVKDLKSLAKVSKPIQKKIYKAAGDKIYRLLGYAANCSKCNFTPDMKYSLDDIIPPYRNMRKFARFLNAGAWAAINSGNEEKGAHLLVRTFRFGDDAESYGPLISYMIGLAIRRIAMDSMENFIRGDFKPENKKIIIDYLKSLPTPAFNFKEGIYTEQKWAKRFFKKLDKNPLLLADAKLFEANPKKKIAKDRACAANQRVFLGALEMAMMDKVSFGKNPTAESVLKILVEKQYLKKTIVCPAGGKYKIEFIDSDDFDVSCSCGVKPGDIAPQKKEAKPVLDQYQVEMSKKYCASPQYQKDKEEVLKHYEEIMKMNVRTIKDVEKYSELMDKPKTTKNIILKTVMPNMKKVVEMQVKFQERIDTLIK